MKKLLLALAALLSLLMVSSLAQADVITNWNYSANVVLTNMKYGTGPVGISGPKGPKQTLHYDAETGAKSVTGYNEYRWGSSAGNSGLKVTGSSGAIKTDGGAVQGITVTHDNQVITGGYRTLTSGTIFTTVALDSGDGYANYTVGSSLDFYFLETPNYGLPTDNDIFFMTSAEIMKSLGSFDVDGVTYYVSIYTKLQALSGDFLRMAQQSLGVGSDVMLYGWTTKEGQSITNGYDLKLSVTLTPPQVPVPAAIWLMGTGVAGLIACRKRIA